MFKTISTVISNWEKEQSPNTDTWENEGGACHFTDIPKSTDPNTIELQKHWSKCPFCGASNGKYNTILQQHRPRCRWLGDADNFASMHPNYSKMIFENDPHHLSMMQAKHELEVCQKELERIKKPKHEPI